MLGDRFVRAARTREAKKFGLNPFAQRMPIIGGSAALGFERSSTLEVF
jgi:hypothetical protein